MENNFDKHKLVIRDLSVKMAKKLILDHVNFEVEDGEFLSILSPSGCGKTTILRIIKRKKEKALALMPESDE